MATKIKRNSSTPIELSVLANNIEPIASKTYSGVIATANNFASATFYFCTVRPTTWYKVWKIKYRIQATSGTDNNYAGSSIVEMHGCQASRLTYSNFNNHYNSSYRSYSYHDLYSLTSTGYTNGYGHAVGVELTNSANSTNATYARTFIVDILESENCDVTMLNTMTLYANLVGTGGTNYNGYSQFDGQNNGLRESSDDNNYDRLMMTNNRLYAGTKGIYGSQLVMQKADGFWESLTSTYSTATNKTKNTSGFLLSNMLLYTSGATVTSGNLTDTWANYDSLDNYTFQYSSNCGATLVAYKSLYLVGTISNGLFYLDNVWWTQTLPTTDDGKVYIYIGETINTTNFSLYPTHPIYAYVNGYLRNVTDYSLMSVGTATSIEWN